jgi:hypothetical protein
MAGVAGCIARGWVDWRRSDGSWSASMSGDIILMLVGLAFNFVTLLIGIAVLASGQMRFHLRIESRLSVMETKMEILMRAHHVEAITG